MEGCNVWTQEHYSSSGFILVQPCQQAKRYVKSFGAEDKIAYIDVEENEALVSEYKIKNLSTFILLDFDGKEVERFTGFDKTKIDALLAKI